MMRRVLAGLTGLTGLTALAAMGAGAALAAAPAAGARTHGARGHAAAPAPANPTTAALTGFACASTLDPTQRTVSVTSVMRPVPGTRTLAVKFSLLERAPGAAELHSVVTGDLGQWLAPADPTLGSRAKDIWKLAKTVSDVDAPAAYRFSVAFRWEGTGGRVLAVASRRTPLCSERELRPDVLVARVIVRPSAHHPRRGGRARYVAVVANRGLTASGPFSVVFTPGTGARALTRTVASLPPGARLRVSFAGPACQAASPPTVAADPAGQVDDYDRSNNMLTVACPAQQGD
jgi:hypothetical protein